MDVISISTVAGLGPEPQNKSTGQRQTSRLDDKTANRQNSQEQKKLTGPDDIHDTRRIRQDVINNLHGLDQKQARDLLAETSKEISTQNAWSLAELQPVLDSSLMKSAYV